MDFVTDRPSGEPTTVDQANGRPWAAPGPDAHWWHGDTTEVPEVPPARTRRPARARHRESNAKATPAALPAPQSPPEPPPTAKPEAGPEAQPEPKPELKPEAGPGRKPKAGPEPKSGTRPEPKSGTRPEPKPEARPEPKPEARPEPKPEARPEPKPEPAHDDAAWPAPKLRAGRLPRTVIPGRPRQPGRYRPTRRPGAGLVALLALGLLAVFFAWVSAEPVWLAVGHGSRGTATVASCTVHGIAKRCADFTADGGTFTAAHVTLLGTGPVPPPVGGKLPARMVSATGTGAYVGSVRLRIGLGLLGVLLCGLGIGWLTGAFRLPTRRGRLVALGYSLAGPFALTGVVLAATW
jgi:hypothetical protein